MPLFIAAGIAAAGSIGGALIGSSSASSAADAQKQGALLATAEQSREFNQTQTNLQPWLQTGTGALSQLAALYGITPMSPSTFGGGTTQQNPSSPIASGTQAVSGPQAAQALIASGRVNPQNGQNSSPIQDIARAISQGIPITDVQWAQAGYGPGGSVAGQASPQVQTPTLAQANPVAGNNVGAAGGAVGGAAGGTSNVNPYATFYQSPDYQFRLAQGIGGVDAGAAARGTLDSGATRKAEIGYAGNLAAGDYNNYANRLAALAGVGQTTANNLGTLGANYASNVGNIAVNQGNNLASSYLAQGQNYGNTLNNLAGIGSGLIRNGAFGSGGATPTSPGYVDWGF